MNSFWDTFNRASCYPHNCNCEAFSDGLILQPVCTITSIPLLLFGIYYCIKMFPHSKKKSFLAFLMAFVALGSVAFHTSLTQVGEALDHIGICLIFLWLYYFAKRSRRFYIRIFFIATITLILMLSFPKLITFLTIFIGSFCTFELTKRIKIDKKIIAKPIAILATGLCFFFLDKYGWCPTNPWLQGHTIWHITVFISCILIYRRILIYPEDF